MRNPVQNLMPLARDDGRRTALRAAIRQLECANLYLAAAEAMELGDREASRALVRLRGDIDALRHHLIDLRAET